LDIVFSSKISKKLSFIGGTCLRIVYGTSRFSEDLDFDNFNLSLDEFTELSNEVRRNLELEGYIIEIKIVSRKAFKCYIKIPNLLFDEELTGFSNEKITIQLDSEAQGYSYKPERYLLNKFDIFTHIFVTPQNILLSQKLWVILNRKVLKGRDIYDVTFLFSLTEPDYDYLYFKAKINNLNKLKDSLNKRLKNEKLEKIAKDVESFLINPKEVNRILNFKEFINQL
ncbi:MAG: nucleotidyl transferase AbiEii/AbiGii toxin family protein, partial [Ignavibacterium sp.]|nr:nucleotidyl transferase AbiEii/AbiGii toxin family protein [Ignavibacterium sp.]